jgi:hypothetical protein
MVRATLLGGLLALALLFGTAGSAAAEMSARSCDPAAAPTPCPEASADESALEVGSVADPASGSRPGLNPARIALGASCAVGLVLLSAHRRRSLTVLAR